MISPIEFISPPIDPRIFSLLIFLSILWVLPWKGVALWKAARNSHKIWFVALLILNTLAILEIIYIFIFSKKKPKITS